MGQSFDKEAVRRSAKAKDLTLNYYEAGPDRPTWVVVAGTSLGTWGVDATEADRLLDEHYAPATTAGDWTIYRSETP